MGTPKYPIKQISIKPELWDAVSRIAKELNIPKNKAVEFALEEFVKSQTF